MSNLTFSENAWEEYLYWQVEDRKILKKINNLLEEVRRHPYKGKGKPEPLKGSNPNTWSRRINKKDRLVYEVSCDGIMIKQCKGHYDDK